MSSANDFFSHFHRSENKELAFSMLSFSPFQLLFFSFVLAGLLALYNRSVIAPLLARVE